MNFIIGKKGRYSLYIVILSLILVIQLSQWVTCLSISGLDTLSSESKHELYTLLLKKRFSFLELYLLEGEKKEEEVKSEADEQIECMLSIRYSKLIGSMTGDHGFDVVSERNKGIRCLRRSLRQLSSIYARFLDFKLIYKPACLERICTKKPEKILFEQLEDLALSIYSILSLNNLVKVNGGFVKELELPQELEHRNEVISTLNGLEKLNSYKEGLKVCMKFNMLGILIYPGFNNTSLLSDYKTFSSILRILTINIEKQVNLYKYNGRRLENSRKKSYAKKMSSNIKNIKSFIKLLSYVVLTKYFVITDIMNTETYEQIYKSISNIDVTG
ncbi:uncharacterized protein ELE39_002251 [Cryptosporidium sp. chipmunk genotype I]|uniref:uncharacterized protein n=1 Tax=Cryptosporidium sp. chipmunk genotype I TaxID=1280935 RepID=UPI00351A9D85|nr:hypothetical protein ELE39_002251 [Cryptosporidium sp. chipmunk genotype I]